MTYNNLFAKLLSCTAAGMISACVCKAESRITVPEVESVKVLIDGKEGVNEWENASLIAPMLSMKNDAEIMPNGQVYLLCDKENIYIAVKTDFQTGTDEGGKQFLKALAQERDSEVFKDDAVEFILSAEKDSPRYHQIIVNSIGTVYDAEYGPDGANVRWDLDGLETASTVNGTSWFLEVKLPRKELGLDGKSGFLLNICRDWAQIRL
ncbi:MAG: carbohydrate-binding family 9-like protein, partial [Lentisphaeria bacterium]|nr:carbohydrate-binding family 9-like protein [Lentisphaeria bacterium]